MNESRIELNWILPPGTGAMSVAISPAPDNRLARVEADMRSRTSGIELTVPACRKLLGFIHANRRANVSPGNAACFGILPWEGLYVDVLAEHADEIAARIAVFITDPANHAVRPQVRATVLVGSDLLSAKCRTWTEKHARFAVEQARSAVASELPELIADPLGKIPGNRPNGMISLSDG